MLKPVGQAPEFTKLQVKSDTHKFVSKIWFDQCLTHDQVMEQIETGIREREDIHDTLGSMRTDIENGMFGFRYRDGRFFKPTDHAITQLGTHIGVSTYFLKDIRTNPQDQQGRTEFHRDEKDAETLKTVVDNALRRMDMTKQRKFRTYNDGTMRAWLSEKYSEVDNRWYLELMKELIPDGRYSHWKSSEDTILGNILIPDSIMVKPEWDSEYGGMVNIGNCEIGTRRIHQLPSIFRAICMNGCIWEQNSASKTSQVHRGKIDMKQLRLKIVDNVTKQIKLSHSGIERLISAQSHELDNNPVGNVIVTICNQMKLSKGEILEVLKQYNNHESEHRNMFGIVNSITRASQLMSPDRWQDMDSVAGEILAWDANKWERQLHLSKSVTKEEMAKLLA